MHYPTDVGGRQGYSTATYPQALPQQDPLDRLGKLTAIQDQDQNSTMNMLHSLYGIQGDMQLRPEHLRELQLKNDALQNENAWAQPNAEQNYNLKGAQIGRLNAETDSQKEQEPDLRNMFMLQQAGITKPEDMMQQLKGSKVYGGFANSYLNRLGVENAGKEHERAALDAQQHPKPPPGMNLPDFAQADSEIQSMLKDQEKESNYYKKGGELDTELQRNSVRGQVHPAVQFMKDLWTAYQKQNTFMPFEFNTNASPRPGFSFGATSAPPPPPPPAPRGTALDRPAYDQQGQGNNQLFDIFARALEAKQQLASNVVNHGRHLGMGGAEITESNPMGNSGGDPWGAKGLFHGGFASQMSPESLAMSQGGSAVNQWNHPDVFNRGSMGAPPPTDAQKGVVTSPGVGAFSPRGERQFQGPNGLSTEFDPRMDQAEGLSGILAQYDPALGGGRRPQLQRSPFELPR